MKFQIIKIEEGEEEGEIEFEENIYNFQYSDYIEYSPNYNNLIIDILHPFSEKFILTEKYFYIYQCNLARKYGISYRTIRNIINLYSSLHSFLYYTGNPNKGKRYVFIFSPYLKPFFKKYRINPLKFFKHIEEIQFIYDIVFVYKYSKVSTKSLYAIAKHLSLMNTLKHFQKSYKCRFSEIPKILALYHQIKEVV